MGAANPLGFLLGSISSGLATRYASWRESFLVVAIFFFMLAGLAVGTMPSLPRAGTARRLLRDFDPLGTVLIVTGTAGLSAALTEGPELGWGSYQVLLLLFVGVGALLLLAVWEPHAASPLIPPRIFADATFSLTLVCAALGYMSFVTNLFWVSLFMQDVQLLSPLTIAVRLLPQALVGPLWSYLGEELVRFVSGRLVMGVGGLGYLGGAVLTLLMRSDSSYWLILLPALCITVLGADFQFIVSNVRSFAFSVHVPHPKIEKKKMEMKKKEEEKTKLTHLPPPALHRLAPLPHPRLPRRRPPSDRAQALHLPRPRHNLGPPRRRPQDARRRRAPRGPIPPCLRLHGRLCRAELGAGAVPEDWEAGRACRG